MGAEKGKKQRSEEVEEERNGMEVIDEKLVQCVEKLQSIQEDLEKVFLLSLMFTSSCKFIFLMVETLKPL